jgi:hypothetical protein
MMAQQSIVRAFEAMEFDFDDDAAARIELEHRLAESGRRRDLVRYSELVRGVTFHLPNVESGKPIQLGIPDWTDLHRAIIGSNLGRISKDSYLEGRFLASALAVSKADGSPGEGFRDLVEQAGLLSRGSDLKFLEFWVNEVEKAYAWYAKNPNYRR